MLNAQLLQLPDRVGKIQRIGMRPRQLRAERLQFEDRRQDACLLGVVQR